MSTIERPGSVNQNDIDSNSEAPKKSSVQNLANNYRVNQPETTIEPQKKKVGRYVGIGAGVAGVALAGTLFAGLANNSEQGNSAPVTDQPEIAEPEQPVTDGETGPVAGVDTLPFSVEPFEQTVGIEAMDAMSIEEFAQLPYADRLAFALDKNPQLAITTMEQDLGFSDPQSIPLYFWNSVSGTALASGDTTEGAKIATANQYYVTDSTGQISEEFRATIESIQATGGEGVRNENMHVFVGNGEPQTITDRDGNSIDVMNITHFTGDSSTGERKDEDRTTQAIRVPVKLLNGSTVVYYPFGFSTPGQQSPISGGTY